MTAHRIAQDMSMLTETEVRPHIVVWTPGGEDLSTSFGANCTAIIADRTVVLVDPLASPAHARQVDAALRARTQAPVRFVVLTHHHADHALGASLFARQGAAVITHRACRERMIAEHPALIEQRRAQPATREWYADAEPVLPAVTFDDGLTLHAGGREIEIWHQAWGHTPGDAFLFLPADRVAVCGDLASAGYHHNYADASLDGLRRGLDALRALDADVFIPGHGPVGGAEVIERQAAYHDAVEALVRGAADEGRDDTATAAAIRERFPDYKLTMVIPTAVARLRGPSKS